MATNLVLFHRDLDGFLSALAFWMNRGSDKEDVYRSVQYDELPPFELLKGGMFNRIVILDFSYSREDMVKMSTLANEVLIIDHHKSAIADLTDWEDKPSNIETVFDVTQAGCWLAWEYFMKGERRPVLYQHAGCRDIGIYFNEDHAMYSEEGVLLNNYVFMKYGEWLKLFGLESNRIPRILESLDHLVAQMDDYSDREQFLSIGQGMQLQKKVFTNMAVEMAQQVMLDKHQIWSVCSANLQSEIGHELAKRGPFGLVHSTYFIGKDRPRLAFKVGLRSLPKEKGGVDVSLIAMSKDPRGGGHYSAAGFTWRDPLYKLLKALPTKE